MFSKAKRLALKLSPQSKSDKKLKRAFKIITGKAPVNCNLYKQAMSHVSAAEVTVHGTRESYERLEYLGDAILGMVVAEYLYLKYPFEEEGFLTEIRSKIVNRESINELAKKIGLKELVIYSKGARTSRTIYGDCLEALIGAIYLDHGFNFTKKFIIRKLINQHFNMKEVIATTTNFKSKLLEWSQKENINLRFKIISESERKFCAQVFLNDEPCDTGYGFSKKKAEQDAARKVYESLSKVP